MIGLQKEIYHEVNNFGVEGIYVSYVVEHTFFYSSYSILNQDYKDSVDINNCMLRRISPIGFLLYGTDETLGRFVMVCGDISGEVTTAVLRKEIVLRAGKYLRDYTESIGEYICVYDHKKILYGRFGSSLCNIVAIYLTLIDLDVRKCKIQLVLTDFPNVAESRYVYSDENFITACIGHQCVENTVLLKVSGDLDVLAESLACEIGDEIVDLCSANIRHMKLRIFDIFIGGEKY